MACFFFELGHERTQDFDVRGLQHELHRESTALRTDALRFEHHHAQVGIFVTEHLDGTRNFALRATRLLVVVQEDAHSRIARIPRTRLDFGILVGIHERDDFFGKGVGHTLGTRERHALGHVQVHHDRVGVFGRGHFATHVVEAEIRRKQQGGHQREQQYAELEEQPQKHRVTAVEPVKERFGDAEEPSLLLAAQELGTEHRRKRKRAERRKEHRPDHHRHELAEEKSRSSAQRKHRHEHRHQNDRGRNHREKDFVRSRDRGLLGRHAVFNLVVDIFHNHDSVVDHEANRQHHR